MNQKKILRHVAFLQKFHISANKSCRQVFNLRCTLTKLMSHDEVTRLDGTLQVLLTFSHFVTDEKLFRKFVGNLGSSSFFLHVQYIIGPKTCS